MKNIKIYWERHEMRADGEYYDQLILETKNNILILWEHKSKN